MNRVRVVPFVWMCSALVVAACGGDDKKLELGGSCSLNSDCADGLLCRFGSCHKACVKSVDCAAGERCVQVDGVAVCQLTSEAACKTGGTCSAPLICQVADNTCRNQCVGSDSCLPGQTCSGTVCIETKELTPVSSGDGGAGLDGGTGFDAIPASLDLPMVVPDAAPFDVAAVVADARSVDVGTATRDTASASSDGGAVDSSGTPAKCSGTPLTVTYDGTATPDSPAFAALFSTGVQGGASWSASGGELCITSMAGAGAWFGSDPSIDKVSWKLATWEEGNTLTIRCKLGPNSQGFHAYFYDKGPSIYFMPGYVMLTGSTRYDVDTSVYHTYLLSEGGWKRSYSIDGVEVASQSLPVTPSTYQPYIIIGDGSGPSLGAFGYETGTFYITEAVIKSYTACTP